ncbi:beta-ketoacyl-[acyl-carrier-protein] synthase family protein [Actinokineospora guangxiensis]|uniref:Beta-ketoacyl-[acyl-carrier-protein] synthase family protein n=1 Tax=Actinokineospora guangxiensis TaxID=1490288 RepID=A0ABW0ERS7_9PSEU
MSRAGIAVTGLGVVTAAGIGAKTTWARVCAAEPTAADDPALTGLPVTFSCTVPGFDAAALVGPRSELSQSRFTQLALVAAREAVADARLEPATWRGARVGVVVGTALGGVPTLEAQRQRMGERGHRAVSPLLIPMFMPNMAAGHIAMDLGATGPNFVVASACASGASAICAAAELLWSDRCDVVIAGGADAAITPLIVSSFARMGALSRRVADPARASRPFDVARDGFVIGEGSGMLVMERAADATARGVSGYARLAGYGASADAHHMTEPDPSGGAVARAVAEALDSAGITPSEVDHVNAHGTSTPLNDLTEARTLARTLGEGFAVSSAKGVLGHTLGAAGAIEAALSVLSVSTGEIPPTANLERQDPEIDLDVVSGEVRTAKVDVAVSNSFGFGGQNAVLVFTT